MDIRWIKIARRNNCLIKNRIIMDEITSKQSSEIINDKVCIKCHQTKLFSEFTKCRRGLYGLHGFCRQCLSLYNQELYQRTKDIRKIQVKEWGARHHEQTKIYKLRSYHKKNGGEIPKLPNKKKPKKLNPLDDLPPIDPNLNF